MWSDPESGSQVEFDSFVHLAQTAERGQFDFFFLAEGLRLREHRGRIHDLDVVGRPDTSRSCGTGRGHRSPRPDRHDQHHLQRTFEVARQFATLDHLSDGRAGWKIVTSSDAFTGENFRRGGFLDHSDRYKRAEEFVTVAREFWDSWAPDAVLADRDNGVYIDPTRVRMVEHRGPQFDVRGVVPCRVRRRAIPSFSRRGLRRRSGVPGQIRRRERSPCIRPWRQASPTTRTSNDRQRRTAEIQIGSRCFRRRRSCSATHRRRRPSKARHIRRQQVGPQTAIAMLEQVWQRDLSDYDPDGPLPDVEPADDPTITQGRVRHGDPKAVAAAWRGTCRGREPEHPGTGDRRHRPSDSSSAHRPQVAEEIDLHVQSDACDGFILVPHLTPRGLDDFVDRVVPLLQERGSFRTEYSGHTLRDHLGL